MTAPEVKSGIYEANDGNDITVDGKPYPITIAVANWIRDKKYQSGLSVTFEIKEQNGRRVVTKVYPTPSKQAAGPDPDKLKKHGFGESTPGPAPVEQKQEEKKDCTSSDTPADAPPNAALKTVEGQITFIDPAAHKITVKDRAGASHTMVWPPALHDKMIQQKQWWFVKITGEHQTDFDIWKLMACDFFKRPDDWPAPQHGSGGWKGQPRNERLILFQNLHTAALDGAMHATTPDSQDYDEFMDMVYVRAKKDTERAMKDFGGA